MKRNPDLGAAIDERLAAAVDRANYQITLNTQKQNARLKLEVDLTYATGGGVFKIGSELISFVQTLINRGNEDAVLLDIKDKPIFISDLNKFQEEIIELYYEAMNEYLFEFKRIQKARKTEALVQ
jgi:hypothetical protein